MRKSAIALIILFIFFLLACTPAVKGPAPITEAEINSLLDKMDKLVRAKDVDAIIALLSEDVEVSITARGPMGTTKQVLNRVQYEAQIRQGMALTRNYDLKRKTRSITISPDGQSAVVEIEIYEVAEVFGLTLTSVADETSAIQRRDGKLVFVRIEAEADISHSMPQDVEQAPGQGI